MECVAVNTRRRALTLSIAALLAEVGFDSVEKPALETLVEMFQSMLTEMGNSTRAFCELACRTEPVVGDVAMALVNMGVPLDGLEVFAYRSNRIPLPTPAPSTQPKQPSILQAGVKHPHPPHIPNHLPPFPDPHAYIRTPTHKQPVTEYEAIREKAASQKRDVERALTRFMAKTGDTHSLFLTEDNNMFPLIACKPQFPPYLKALLPQDQVFDPEEEFTSTPQRARKARELEGDGEGDGEGKEEEEEGGRGGEGDAIDNPYLRPVKLPRRKKAKA
ncbi:transcription initiation factor TFIID subunit 8 [Bacillus rossius redtenbacheri]|uniref:transcription initiation factor TFIID subunit 8 n=1 Tax=Bacillus rossius redtenbacheri TaxID=93214 RepID=UPI002FDD0E65